MIEHIAHNNGLCPNPNSSVRNVLLVEVEA